MDTLRYPNPTLNGFSIQSINPKDLKEIFVFDVIGNLIQQFDSMPYHSEIDLTSIEKAYTPSVPSKCHLADF